MGLRPNLMSRMSSDLATELRGIPIFGSLAEALASLSVFFSTVFFLIVALLVVWPTEARHSVLYQIARQMDFNDQSRCIPKRRVDQW